MDSRVMPIKSRELEQLLRYFDDEIHVAENPFRRSFAEDIFSNHKQDLVSKIMSISRGIVPINLYEGLDKQYDVQPVCVYNVEVVCDKGELQVNIKVWL